MTDDQIYNYIHACPAGAAYMLADRGYSQQDIDKYYSSYGAWYRKNKQKTSSTEAHIRNVSLEKPQDNKGELARLKAENEKLKKIIVDLLK